MENVLRFALPVTVDGDAPEREKTRGGGAAQLRLEHSVPYKCRQDSLV